MALGQRGVGEVAEEAVGPRGARVGIGAPHAIAHDAVTAGRTLRNLRDTATPFDVPALTSWRNARVRCIREDAEAFMAGGQSGATLSSAPSSATPFSVTRAVARAENA